MGETNMKIPEGKNFYTSNKDRQFHVKEMIDWGKLSEVRTVDKESYNEFLEQTVGEVIGKRIAPRAPKSERQDYRIENGSLVWPEEIQKSYNDLKDNGLLCVNISEQNGGLGLPNIITTMISEMIFQADPGFATVPLLQSGVAEMIEVFGTKEMKAEYLGKMIAGEYTGAMDLTEPDAGSDLGGIRTKAETADGKTYITGTKTFITNGGADVHLVLARDADNYKGTLGKMEGISLYLVPKNMGGKSNNVNVTKLEEKLGIHSSPTCEVCFDDTDKGARGFLIGKKGEGLRYMFHLMNNARLGVSAQALGTLEASLSDARDYAEERKQFGMPISKQRLVKDMLTEMQDYAEVIRSLVYTASFATDMEAGLMKDEDGSKELRQYQNQAAVLVPLVKFFAAEKAIELTKMGLQVHGGVGYTKEFNAERYLRDAVITSIYEGTSEIQVSLFMKEALKAVANPKKSRANPLVLLDEVDRSLETIVDNDMKGTAKRLGNASRVLRSSFNSIGIYLMQTRSKDNKYGDIDSAITHAKRIAMMASEVYGSYQLLMQSKKSDEKKDTAKRFIMNMEPRVNMYSEQIENALDLYPTKRSTKYEPLMRKVGSMPEVFSLLKKFV